MTDWQFLIQRAGDRAWLPLDASSTEILEGRYRIVARSSRSNVPAEIRITHYALAEIPPKRRVQRRSSRINADGLMMILPFTLLKPGVWEVCCMADVMADFFGESWSHSVRLQVLASSEALDDGDLEAPLPGEPEPAVVKVPATRVANAEPAILLGRRCANAPAPRLPHPLSPPTLPDPSPADLPLVAATATEPDPASGVPAPVPELAAIAPPLPDAIALEPQPEPVASSSAEELAQSLAQDLDQAMQSLLATLATAPLDPAAMASGMTAGGAANLGPLTTAAAPDHPPAVAVPEVQERLQAIAQQISEQVVERALQEFDLDAVFSGLQEWLETLPASTAAATAATPDRTPTAREIPLVAKLSDTPPAAAVDVSDVAGLFDLSDLSDSTVGLPDADLLLLGPLQLSLEQEAYVVRRGQPLRLQGVVSPSDEVVEITTTAIGELQLYLRDPQTLKVLASTYQLLPIATLPVDFSCEVRIPSDCATQLLLGEVNLVQLTQPDAPLLTDELPWAERQRLQEEAAATGRVLAQSSAQTAHLLATYAFTIATDVTELLPHGVLVPDPHVIDPPARQPERPRIELPMATAIAAPLPLQPSPAAKAPTAAAFRLKQATGATSPESVDLPVFTGLGQFQRPQPSPKPTSPKPMGRPTIGGISLSFIEISKRMPVASVPTRPAACHPLPEQIYHPDPDTLRQLSPKLPPIPSLSPQLATPSQGDCPERAAGAVRVNPQVELVMTHASVALPTLPKQPEMQPEASIAPESPLAAVPNLDGEDRDSTPLPTSHHPDATGEATAEPESGPARCLPSLRSLNLGQRFWSRLNAIAADAELADWLREQAEAEAESESESPAIAAFMTEGPLEETDDSPGETWCERSDNDDWADGWPAQTWPVDNGEADWPAEDWLETDDAPLAQTLLEPEDWEGEAWSDDDGEAPVAAFDEGVEYAFADACEDDGGGIDLDNRDTLDDFDEDQAALVETTPEAAIWVEGEAEASLDAPDVPSPHGRRSIEQLQALTPDPMLTAEMEAFLKALEQGPDWSALQPASPSRPEVPSELAASPETEATRTAWEIEAMLMPRDEARDETLPNSPSPVLPCPPAPHTEIVIEDEPPSPAAHSPGRILSHPSLFYRLADDEPVPVPLLCLPNQELVAGQSITLCVRLAKTPARLQVKVWVQDRQTRQVLDGPRWLVDFFPCGDAVVEAWTQLTVPLGCLEIQFEAIAIEIYSQRESHKTSLERSVLPPDLAVSAVSRQGYSLA
ncbi:hypothetical protein OOK60_16345 [Trichothermofontia sichuanensis B231]|uniref:hypothetical protein n=1 Tax=Trichothermofontia sichuanensis TaxID=3045816 RepID=UPI0022457FFB|nr:hypothetical protein [Trichothermofontia sichuanensis]UZQ54041.1 hypothetical protein OOK60_16345 [Trichothermofontia sichuanensis B231]